MTILIGEWDNNVAVPVKGRGYKVPLFSKRRVARSRNITRSNV